MITTELYNRIFIARNDVLLRNPHAKYGDLEIVMSPEMCFALKGYCNSIILHRGNPVDFCTIYGMKICEDKECSGEEFFIRERKRYE